MVSTNMTYFPKDLVILTLLIYKLLACTLPPHARVLPTVSPIRASQQVHMIHSILSVFYETNSHENFLPLTQTRLTGMSVVSVTQGSALAPTWSLLM